MAQEHFGDAKAELYLDSVRAALDAAKEPFMETSIVALGAIQLVCRICMSAWPLPILTQTLAASLALASALSFALACSAAVQFSRCKVLYAGHIALACPDLEAECALLIAAHVARQPLQLDLGRCVLDQCARQLGYPDRAAYAHMFAWSTASAWFRLGYSLQELLGVQVCLCCG